MVANKIYATKSKKLIKNTREKKVTCNISADDSDADAIVQNMPKKDGEHPNSNNLSPKQSTRNQPINHPVVRKSSLVARGKNSQQNLSLNKGSLNKENKILYFITKEGSVIGYHFNEIIKLLKKHSNGGDLAGDWKKVTEKNFSMVGSYAANMA